MDLSSFLCSEEKFKFKRYFKSTSWKYTKFEPLPMSYPRPSHPPSSRHPLVTKEGPFTWQLSMRYCLKPFYNYCIENRTVKFYPRFSKVFEKSNFNNLSEETTSFGSNTFPSIFILGGLAKKQCQISCNIFRYYGLGKPQYHLNPVKLCFPLRLEAQWLL